MSSIKRKVNFYSFSFLEFGSVNNFVRTLFYSQLPNIFCKELVAALNPRCTLPKNLALYSLAYVQMNPFKDSIDGNCSL